ncbi:M15 family metallopeptidase [Saccharopolyspora sp. ID03-671]|uniref:M15 family metallopeptidase n=1 Tax=Saccharopolyspora sp. ID03-671 TaxID=3073066 RepID=UPI00324AD2D2
MKQAPDGFVRLRDVDSSILEDVRYATPHNFTGDPVPGYDEPMCVLTRPLAEALHRAQQQLVPEGYSLKVYDCYRPQQADDRFVEWAQNDDHRMKDEFYPGLAKSELYSAGYIAENSGHSRGSSVDLTLVRLPAAPQRPYVPGEPLHPCTDPEGKRFPDNSVDMGTGFDCFDDRAHTDDPRITGEARANRDVLRDAMTSVGLQGYSGEWWHFNLPDEPFPGEYFDFPVNSAAFR